MNNHDIKDTMLGAAIMALLMFLTGLYVDEAEGQQLERVIVESARHHGIDPTLALAIADVESNMNPEMVGGIGEIGIFQLRPEYHRVVRGDVYQNTNVAMRYLVYLKGRCAGYGEAFFVCYNYGPSRPLKHPKLFPYYKKVKAAQMRRQNANLIAGLED